MEVQASQRKMTKETKGKTSLKWVVDKNIIVKAGEGEVILRPLYEVQLLGEISAWKIELYPKGFGDEKGKSVSLYLQTVKIENPDKTKVCFNFGFMNHVKLNMTEDSTFYPTSQL